MISEEQYNDLLSRFDILDVKLGILIRNKMGNKEQILYDKVKEKGRIITTEIMRMLNVSRSHSHTLMKKLAKNNPGFTVIPGNKQLRKCSILIYNEAKVLEQQFQVIDKIILEKEVATLHDVMGKLNITISEAELIAKKYCRGRAGIFLEEGIKLIRK
jgi:hypothetical protein